MVLILGIETSCDETGIAIVEDGSRIVSEKLKSSVDLQAEYGGVVPELASRVHVEYVNILIKEALDEAGLTMTEIDAVAVANGPGLVGALLVGTMVAKTIGLVEKKKLIAVNHLEGHIFSSFLSLEKKDEKLQVSRIKNQVNEEKLFRKKDKIMFFPMMVLIVSGGHTELVLMEDYGVYKILGSTIDDAAGEAFDKAAKILGLPYPGGPSIAQSAVQVSSIKDQGSSNEEINLPRPMLNSKDYNFSFSGLKTALLYKITNDKLQITNEKIRNMLAWEFQEAVCDVLAKKTKRAMEDLGVKRLAVVGGVAANQRLREKLHETIDDEIAIPEFKYCTDNGVKIATAGYYKYRVGNFIDWQDLEVKSNWSL